MFLVIVKICRSRINLHQGNVLQRERGLNFAKRVEEKYFRDCQKLNFTFDCCPVTPPSPLTLILHFSLSLLKTLPLFGENTFLCVKSLNNDKGNI